MKKHVDKVGTKNEQMCGQWKKKVADGIEHCSKASELRSAAKKAIASERAVCRATT